MLILCTLTSWYGLFIRAYSSFKLLSRQKNDPELSSSEIIESLQFWIIFAHMWFYEWYLEFTISWVPFYSVVKLAFLWYLILPQTKGTAVIFEHIFQPLLGQVFGKYNFYNEWLSESRQAPKRKGEKSDQDLNDEYVFVPSYYPHRGVSIDAKKKKVPPKRTSFWSFT